MMTDHLSKAKHHVAEFGKEAYSEIAEECCMPTDKAQKIAYETVVSLRQYIHIPFFPALHSPGWAARYVLGPYTPELLESLIWDATAGITVALTLIPQALSYAQLANLPPICGLYTAILPSIAYSLIGSSLQLAVGPVALVSLLTGQLVAQYVPDYATNTEAAMDTAAQAALCCGIILCVMSILNLGHLINFIAMPVMSGFTTAAACLIGLSQLKSAFGFSQGPPNSVTPQTGQEGYEYNYQVMRWYKIHFYDRFVTYSSDSTYLTKGEQHGHLWFDPYCVKIFVGLYIPLIISQNLKNYIPATPERKKQLWYRVFVAFNSFLPFLSIIIGAHIAWYIHRGDGYTQVKYDHSWYKANVKVIGKIQSGLHFIRMPKMRWPFGKFFADTIPLTMIAYMESYSVARRIASYRNELHILSASQEMWANGVANLLSCISSAYPVSGSFSRSSLNYASGARTPVSKLVTMLCVVLVLGVLTKTLFFIPNAALAAVIFVAISNLINITDFWEAWKHSKKDFLTISVTAIFVFVFDSSIGLAAGMGCSAFVLLADVVLGKRNEPWISMPRKENNGIDVIKLESDLNFLNSYRIKDFISRQYITPPPAPSDVSSFNEKAFYTITNTLDRYLRPDVIDGVEDVPEAIAVDFSMCRMLDLTGLQTMSEVLFEGRTKKVKFVIFNLHPEIAAQMSKFGIKNDASTKEINLDKYLALSTLKVKDAPVVAEKASSDSAENSGDVETGAIAADDIVSAAAIELTTLSQSNSSTNAYDPVPSEETSDPVAGV